MNTRILFRSPEQLLNIATYIWQGEWKLLKVRGRQDLVLIKNAVNTPQHPPISHGFL